MKPTLGKGLVRSVAVLASGTAAGQAILLLSSPLLTRLYSPSQFGLLAVYMAAVTILGSIATLRYELVIALPKRHDVALNALALTMICVVITAMVAETVILLAGDAIADVVSRPGLRIVGWLVPIGVLGIGSYTALSQWSVRRRSFGVVARTKLVQAVSQTLIQIGTAFTPFSTLGLLFGNLFGQTAGITSFLREIWTRERKNFRRVTFRRIWLLARYYWHFPTFSLIASVAFTAGQQAPSLVMFSMFGPATAGFFLLAQRVSMMPASMLGNAMSQSLYRTIAENRKDPAKVGQVVLAPTRILTNLTIGPAALCAVLAPYATGLFFGHNWVEAGYYLRWMAPWVATTLTFGAMTPVVSVLGYQKMGLVFQVGSLVLSLLAMYVAGATWGPVAAMAALSLTKTACVLAYRLHMFHLLTVSPLPIALSYVVQTILFVAIFSAAAAIGQDTNLITAVRWGGGASLLLGGLLLYAGLNYRELKRAPAVLGPS